VRERAREKERERDREKKRERDKVEGRKGGRIRIVSTICSLQARERFETGIRKLMYQAVSYYCMRP
jgi:hypothetical protein